MSDIVKVLRSRYAVEYDEQELLALCDEAANEIERLRKLDAEAATHVETVICMKSRHFTGKRPYVGWKGLGLALRQDYAELERLRAALQRIAHAPHGKVLCRDGHEEAYLIAKNALEEK